MTKDQISEGASGVLALLNTYDTKGQRAILRAALKQRKVERLTNEKIKSCFVPGQAFAIKAVASAIGATTKRVRALALEAGCVEVDGTKGAVYQAPSASAA